MKHSLIRWLLRLLGAPRPLLPDFHFYAVVESGGRCADVTMNRYRARAIAKEMALQGKRIKIWICVPTAEEPQS